VEAAEVLIQVLQAVQLMVGLVVEELFYIEELLVHLHIY
jgi:hypothetical protein